MKNGFTLVEVVIGVGVLTASFLGILTVFNHLLKANQDLTEISQVAFLLEEGVEAARLFRDRDWANFSSWPSGTAYYLVTGGWGWATTSTPTLVDGVFDRQITVTSVNRDASTHEIVTSGGVLDPDTKLVTIDVAWRRGNATTTQSLSAYFTNIFE